MRQFGFLEIFNNLNEFDVNNYKRRSARGSMLIGNFSLQNTNSAYRDNGSPCRQSKNIQIYHHEPNLADSDTVIVHHVPSDVSDFQSTVCEVFFELIRVAMPGKGFRRCWRRIINARRSLYHYLFFTQPTIKG